MTDKKSKIQLGKLQKDEDLPEKKVMGDVVPDADLSPEKPESTMSFSKVTEPLVLVMDEDKVEEWLVNGHLRIRGVFDRAEVTGEGLENKNGRTGIPGMIVSMAAAAIKPGGVVVVPEELAGIIERLGFKKYKGKNKPGFLSFTK